MMAIATVKALAVCVPFNRTPHCYSVHPLDRAPNCSDGQLELACYRCKFKSVFPSLVNSGITFRVPVCLLHFVRLPTQHKMCNCNFASFKQALEPVHVDDRRRSPLRAMIGAQPRPWGTITRREDRGPMTGRARQNPGAGLIAAKGAGRNPRVHQLGLLVGNERRPLPSHR
jgi:hypothetical protein